MAQAGRNRLCGLGLAVLAVSLLFLLSYSVARLVQLSPLYEPIVLEVKDSEFKVVNLTEVLTESTTILKNPNPYEVSAVMSSVGIAYVLVNGTRVELGTAVMEPWSVGPESSAFPKSTVRGSLTKLMTAGNPATVLTEVPLEISAKYSVFARNIGKTAKRVRYCGVKVRVSLTDETVAGPSKCADSWAELVVPPIDDPKLPVVLNLPEKTLRRAERVRDFVLGSVIGVSVVGILATVGGLVCLLLRADGLCPCSRCRCNARQADAEACAVADVAAQAAEAKAGPEALGNGTV